MQGQMLDVMKEEPIELCHFDCVESDGFKEIFEGHCESCKQLTGDVLVEFLPQIFEGREDTNDAWDKLGEVYCEHGYDVYHSDNYFEVYPAETKPE